MARPRPVPARVLFLVLLALGAFVRIAPAEPERPEGSWRISSVHAAGAGEASEILKHAVEAVEAERWSEAVDALLRLRARHGEALVAVPERWAWEVPLYWPAKHVVELLLDPLPDAARTEVLDAWRGAVGTLVERAEAGDDTALERLGDDWAATEPGRRALRAVVERDLEAGRYAAAARRLEHWLRLPGGSPGARALAVLQLAEALAALGDETALEALPARFEAEVGRTVATARGRLTPRLGVHKLRARLRVRRTTKARRGTQDAALPRDLEVLWTRAHERDGLLSRTARLRTAMRTLGGAAADGEDLILHDGAVVRRIEAFTGRELWRFPPPDEGRWNYDPRHRYAAEDLPLRTVDVAGDLVLVVLGDPAAQGSFEYLGDQVRLEGHARASRTRLVALDKHTGRLRWTTGGPRDGHDVLGDELTGCQSPPLVVGDAVYALFARRRGASEIHLACLDLATGHARWVSYLGTGVSGRSVDADEGDDRFGGKRTRAPPWGARPALAGDEICVLPHAGFAAGVDARDGAVRWLRPLPRFEGYFAPGPEEGFSGRNAPLAYGATWILAPLDSPYLVGLERGSGRWRWTVPSESEDGSDPWHHVVAVSEAPRGGPWLRLLYTESALLDLSKPRAGLRVGPYLDGYLPVGRPMDLGSVFVVAGAWSAGARLTDASADETTVPALSAVPWDVERQSRPLGIRRWALDDADFPRMGDVLRVGDVWVVVGKERTGAVAPPRTARAWAQARRADPRVDAAGRAAAAALVARLDANVEGAGEALRLARATGDAATVDVALDAVRRVVRGGGRGIERLGEVVLGYAPLGGADVLADLSTHAAFRRRPEALVELLDRWIEVDDGPLVTSMPGVAVRSDLFAGLLLRILASDPVMRPALAARERRQAQAVEAALKGDEAALREAIRRAVGTRAARSGREALARRLETEGRHAAAAAAEADVRLGGGARGTGREVRARLAALQQSEASQLARAGYGDRARRLLDDLRRWAPPQGAEAARARSALETLLAMEAGWRPSAAPPVRFDAWRGLEAAADAGDLKSVVFPGLVGPGAATRRDRLLVFRGLAAEIWSRRERGRVASFADAGAGWFGGALQEVPAWLEGGGVIVTSLVAGEPADRAGLREGDWVTAWDGEPVTGASAFMRLVASSEPGVSVALEVRRRGRKVLDRIVPGTRPPRDGVVVGRDSLWIDERGRVLVPGRVDVAWIDLESAVREPFWTWTGAGVVRSVDVVGETAVVLVRRLLQHDTLVGLDLATGAERWRQDVDGTVVRLDGTGSALVVTAANPARAVVVDPRDGSVRMRVDLQERTVPGRVYTLFAAPSSTAVHGRLWCVTGDAGRGRHLRILNTTTGEVASEALDDHGLEPLIAGDGVVALALGGPTLSVLAPDPVTGRPAWRVEAQTQPGPRSFVFDPPNVDTRLFVAGDRLYVLRNRRGRWIRIEVLAIDFEALGPRERRGSVPQARALRALAGRDVREGLGTDAYVTDARATLEGLLLSAATTGDRQRRVAFWMGRTGTSRAWPDPVRIEAGGVVQIRRHAPARAADVLIVPSDEGALLVPLVPGGS